ALPLEAAEPEVGTLELPRDRPLVREADHRERARVAEDEATTGTKQPRGLGDPALRVGPGRRAVLGDDEVERAVRQRNVLPAGLHEREGKRELGLAAPRRVELRRGGIDPDGPSTAP